MDVGEAARVNRLKVATPQGWYTRPREGGVSTMREMEEFAGGQGSGYWVCEGFENGEPASYHSSPSTDPTRYESAHKRWVLWPVNAT